MSSKRTKANGAAKRGFATMDPEKRRKIASAGGRAAHASGNGHEFDAAEAREAGRKGGEAISQDRAYMAEIGRAGGVARSANMKARRLQKEREERAAHESGDPSAEGHERPRPSRTSGENN